MGPVSKEGDVSTRQSAKKVPCVGASWHMRWWGIRLLSQCSNIVQLFDTRHNIRMYDVLHTASEI